MNNYKYFFVPVLTTFITLLILLVQSVYFNILGLIFVILPVFFLWLVISLILSVSNKKNWALIVFVSLILLKNCLFFYFLWNPSDIFFYQNGNDILIDNGVMMPKYHRLIIEEAITYNISFILTYPILIYLMKRK